MKFRRVFSLLARITLVVFLVIAHYSSYVLSQQALSIYSLNNVNVQNIKNHDSFAQYSDAIKSDIATVNNRIFDHANHSESVFVLVKWGSILFICLILGEAVVNTYRRKE
jgi:hypothetical protein